MDVKHEHAKILREALARCGNYGPPPIQHAAKTALSRYAELVGPYCDHPNNANDYQGRRTCLDCGHKPGPALVEPEPRR